MKKLNYTPGPWKWRQAQINENKAKTLKKPSYRLSKRDGSLLLCLSGVRYAPPVSPDSAEEHSDWSFWRCVFRLPWSAIKGNSFGGGPTEEDCRLIQCAPDMYEALIPVHEALTVMDEGEYFSLFDESLNPESHCEVTLTVAEARAVVLALRRVHEESAERYS